MTISGRSPNPAYHHHGKVKADGMARYKIILTNTEKGIPVQRSQPLTVRRTPRRRLGMTIPARLRRLAAMPVASQPFVVNATKIKIARAIEALVTLMATLICGLSD